RRCMSRDQGDHVRFIRDDGRGGGARRRRRAPACRDVRAGILARPPDPAVRHQGIDRQLLAHGAQIEGGDGRHARVSFLDRRGRWIGGGVMTGPTTLEDFEAIELHAEETGIFLRRFGSGPAVLLLHGFPQTHLMWRAVAPLLARRFTVICADLRGYGRSGCPASGPDHAPYAKRAMANDMVSVMRKLGFPRFSVAGHDRGGRVAYRLLPAYPGRGGSLAVLCNFPAAENPGGGGQKLCYRFLPVVAPCAARATSREARVSRS